LKYCAFVGELLIMHIVLASLGSRWWQHMILRDLQHSWKAAEVIGSRKTILTSMIQVRTSDPTISFKMGKEYFRPKSRLQRQSI